MAGARRIFVILFAILYITAVCINISNLVSADTQGEGGDKKSNFIDDVKSWYKKVKEKIFGKSKKDDILMTLLSTNATSLNAYKEIVTKKDSPLFLNLSSVRVNSKKAWGFKIIKWHFIYISDPDATDQDSNSVENNNGFTSTTTTTTTMRTPLHTSTMETTTHPPPTTMTNAVTKSTTVTRAPATHPTSKPGGHEDHTARVLLPKT